MLQQMRQNKLFGMVEENNWVTQLVLDNTFGSTTSQLPGIILGPHHNIAYYFTNMVYL